MNKIPASVLIEICKAIAIDESAIEKAQQQMITVSTEFRSEMTEVILHISDPDVRHWAWTEIRGIEVKDDHDNNEQ